MKLLSQLLLLGALGTVSSWELRIGKDGNAGDLYNPQRRLATSSPTPSPTQAGSTTTVYCFSGDSRVDVAGRGLLDLKDVRVGDEVLTGKDHYQRVYAFGHYNPSEEATFLYVETQIPLEPLKLTPDHLVFVEGKDHPVRAASLTVGDVLLRAKGQAMAPSRISSIRPFVSQGTYTPLTKDATLVVDGIVASSYISLQSDQNEFVEFPIVGTSWKWTHQDYVHWTLAPFRVFCGSVSSNLCQLHSTRGIPYYIESGIAAVQWAHSQGGIVEVVFLCFALALFGVCRFVEATVGEQSLGPMTCMAVATYVYWKKLAVANKKVA